ncbi:hemerythrin [Tardibacter chloracetimidivorans]|uniref:Hemerythrin n=1 Tax=Tardibacter chloracetimidivorans TaxID=1921510 RepID=A0A1L3ZTX0_9SPHN|nr:hemerythrin domain-containing protein [Tardibacter chloracetimidivorans]API59092.1 hemerythrin [Tardibacter chloracetimidivorans]
MPKSSTTDATKLLAEGHRKVEELFEKFEKTKGAEKKQKIVHEICTELNVHTRIEEEIFYPALRGKIEEDDLDEAYVEHDSAKALILELEQAQPDEEYYDAKVLVLKEQIEHHVKEEEKQRDSMFAQARKADVDLEKLGEQLQARKSELMEEAKAGRLAPAEMHTLAS